MAEGRGRFLWEAVSTLLALTANVNRTSKSAKVFKPHDFNPYHHSNTVIEVTKENIGLMREAFTNNKGR